MSVKALNVLSARVFVRTEPACFCFGETNTLLCEQVEPGSLNAIVSVAMNVIGTERINRNKKDVGAGNLFLRRMTGTIARGEQTAEE